MNLDGKEISVATASDENKHEITNSDSTDDIGIKQETTSVLKLETQNDDSKMTTDIKNDCKDEEVKFCQTIKEDDLPTSKNLNEIPPVKPEEILLIENNSAMEEDNLQTTVLQNTDTKPESVTSPKPQIITTNPSTFHNSSLRLISAYDSDTSDSDTDTSTSSDSDEEKSFELIAPPDEIKKSCTDDDSTSDSSSSDDDVADVTPLPASVMIDTDDDMDEDGEAKPKRAPKVKGELSLDDLPPIENLCITVDASDCVKIGKIMSIVNQIVLVEAIPNTAAFDIDTVLFLENGSKTLGKIFDVMGPVSAPLYCIRFNTRADIDAQGIEIGAEVFAAPSTEHAAFVVIDDLMKHRGCDASWEHDTETPSGHVEFSDDEEEARYKREERNRRHQQRPSDGAAPGEKRARGSDRGRGGRRGRGGGGGFVLPGAHYQTVGSDFGWHNAGRFYGQANQFNGPPGQFFVNPMHNPYGMPFAPSPHLLQHPPPNYGNVRTPYRGRGRGHNPNNQE